MSELFELGQAVLASQSFSAHVGAELTRFQPGSAEFTLPLGDHLRQQNGFAHGGAIAFMVDNALTFAGGSVLGPEVLTQGYTITFLRPAVGQKLVARSTVVHSSKRLAVCRCDVVAIDGDEEKVCATALGTIASTA